jgi:hypothetical protein
MDQLMVQVEKGGPRPCGMEGESSVEVLRWWEGAGCCGARPFPEGRALFRKGAPFSGRARPFQRGRALIAYLVGRGLKPLQEVW